MASASSPSRSGFTQATYVFCATISLLVLPVVADLFGHGTTFQKRLFAYSAPDTFYYLTVARNIGMHGHFSFDGAHPSNGYHPLWQVLTALPYALHLPGAHSPWILAYLLAMAMALQCGALYFWSRIFRRDDGSLSWSFVFLPAGVYALLVSPSWLMRSAAKLASENPGEGVQPVYGTLWSYLNGMETSLVLFFFAWVAWLATRENPFAKPVFLGLALTGLAFARLDHAIFSVFIFLGLACGAFREKKPWRERLRAPFIAGLVFALPLVVYALLNLYFMGIAVPISGRIKSTFPLLTIENFDVFLKSVNLALRGKAVGINDCWRVVQSVVPVIFAGLAPFIVLRIRIRKGGFHLLWARPNPRLGALLLMTAAGILVLAAYNFFFVFVYSIGHWYFPVSCLFVTLVCLHGWERIRQAWQDRKRRTATEVRPATRLLRFAKPVFLIGLTSACFVLFQRNDGYHARYADFAVDHGPGLREFLQRRNAKIIDCDDGIVAWVADVPAMSATGLGLDLEAATVRFGAAGLLPLAILRGHTYVATLIYVDTKLLKGTSPRDVEAWLGTTGAFIQLGRFKEYDWSVAYQTPGREFVMVEAHERPKRTLPPPQKP